MRRPSPRPGPARPRQLALVNVARGLAALAIVPYHVLVNVLGPLPWFGAYEIAVAALPVFFVMTGFVLTYVHGGDVGRPERVRPFLVKRFARLYPTLWLLSLAALAAAAALGGMRAVKFQPAQVVRSLAAWPVSDTLPILPQAWTLPHDLKFYLLFVALFVVPRRVARVGGALLLVGVVANTLRHWFWPAPAGPRVHYLVDFAFHPFSLQFAWGVLVARSVMRRPDRPRPGAVLALGVAAFVGAYGADQARLLPTYEVRMFVFGVAAALLLHGLAAYDAARAPNVPRIFGALGEASYAIYLVHIPASVLLTRVLAAALGGRKGLSAPGWVWLQVGLCVAAGVVFYRAVEAPLYARVTARLLGRPRAGSPHESREGTPHARVLAEPVPAGSAGTPA